ncbi:MAG TPA: lipid-binding SYLF domain-containing protein [Acidobacteriota bacterium]|nr:lipid-binding SYLF domain-containing protein [Acidobacteriota bacterium]
MKRIFLSLIAILLVFSPVYASKSKQEDRIRESTEVMKEILDIPEGIPKDLLSKAECVVIIPSTKKAALGIGGEYGRGAILCRNQNTWSPPVMVSLTGGSFGLQLGGTSTDVVLLIMNKRGVDKLLESKVTLGGDASAAGGPKGRTASAETDAQMRAEILSYARSRGLFAGISLDGAVLKPSGDDNEDLYGHRIDPKEVLLKGGTPPGVAVPLINLLNAYPPAPSK